MTSSESEETEASETPAEEDPAAGGEGQTEGAEEGSGADKIAVAAMAGFAGLAAALFL